MENDTSENKILGKRAKNFHDLTGKIYGRLTVIGIERIRQYLDRKGRNKKRIVWKCQCSCGKIIYRETYHMVTGNTKSCGCLKRDLTVEFNKRTKRLDAGYSGVTNLFQRYKYDAKKRNLSWSLSREALKTLCEGNCTYCGKPPSQVLRGQWSDFKYNGIDRLDSKLGYNDENCVSFCGQCNLMKLDLSYEDFVLVIKRIYERHVLKKEYKFKDPRLSAFERKFVKPKKDKLKRIQERTLKQLNPNVDYNKILAEIENKLI